MISSFHTVRQLRDIKMVCFVCVYFFFVFVTFKWFFPWRRCFRENYLLKISFIEHSLDWPIYALLSKIDYILIHSDEIHFCSSISMVSTWCSRRLGLSITHTDATPCRCYPVMSVRMWKKVAKVSNASVTLDHLSLMSVHF